MKKLDSCSTAKNVIAVVSEQWSPLLLQAVYEKTSADKVVSLYTSTTLFNRLFEEYVRTELFNLTKKMGRGYKCEIEYIPVSSTDQLFLEMQLKEVISKYKENSLIIAYGPSLLVFPLILYGLKLNIQNIRIV